MKKQTLFAALLCATAAGTAQPVTEQGPMIVDAVLPLEALAAPPGAEGEIWVKGMRLRSPLIAEQPLRAADAIVIQKGGATKILPVVLIGRASKGARLPTDPRVIAWCDIDRGMPHGRSYDCYQDLDGDGKLEVQRRAMALNVGEPLTIAKMGPAQPGQPLAYRKASAAERPAYRLVYESCGGGLDTIRFIQRLRGAGGGAIDYPCSGLAEKLEVASDGSGLYRIDRMTVRVTPLQNSARAQMVSAIPVGTLLDRIMPTEAVVDLGTRPSYEEELMAAMLKFTRPPFRFAEAPKVNLAATSGDDVLIEGRLGFEYTGRMTKAATVRNWATARSIEAGEPVYGVPMGGDFPQLPLLAIQQPLASRSTMIWCAPRQKEGKWRAACMPLQGSTFTIIENLSPAFLVQSVSYRSDTVFSPGLPEVREEPVDFGVPVIVRYRVTKWSRKEARLETEIQAGNNLPDIERSWVRLSPDGSARFELGGMKFRLLPRGDDKYTATAEGQAVAGGRAIPGGDLRRLR